jgi:hypothetical protein
MISIETLTNDQLLRKIDRLEAKKYLVGTFEEIRAIEAELAPLLWEVTLRNLVPACQNCGGNDHIDECEPRGRCQ